MPLQGFDTVLSDMLQFTSGVNDVELSLELANTAMNVATGHYYDLYGAPYVKQMGFEHSGFLKPGGNLVMKVYEVSPAASHRLQHLCLPNWYATAMLLAQASPFQLFRLHWVGPMSNKRECGVMYADAWCVADPRTGSWYPGVHQAHAAIFHEGCQVASGSIQVHVPRVLCCRAGKEGA